MRMAIYEPLLEINGNHAMCEECWLPNYYLYSMDVAMEASSTRHEIVWKGEQPKYV